MEAPKEQPHNADICDVCMNYMTLARSPWSAVVLANSYHQVCRLCWCRINTPATHGITLCDGCNATFWVEKETCVTAMAAFMDGEGRGTLLCPACVDGSIETIRKSPPVMEETYKTTVNGKPVNTTIRLWKYPETE